MLIKEKTKKHIVISSVILSLLMLFTTLSTIPTTKASHDYDLMCASNMYTTNWLQIPNNAATTAAAFNEIDTLFTQKIFYHPRYMGFINWYGEVWN